MVRSSKAESSVEAFLEAIAGGFTTGHRGHARTSRIRLRGRWLGYRTQFRTDGAQHVPGINTGAVTIAPFDTQGVIAHGTQVHGVDVRRGDGRYHLKGIGWRLLLL